MNLFGIDLSYVELNSAMVVCPWDVVFLWAECQ